MAGILDSVDQRTKLAGHNRLELLLFRLHGNQQFAINVFKVREIIHCPKLVQLPESHHTIVGIANLRGNAVPIIDLSYAMGEPPADNIQEKFVVLTEYNRRTQGFLVEAVEQIINISWEEVFPPPMGVTYMTAVIKNREELIEIVDVEKVLSEIQGFDQTVSQAILEGGAGLGVGHHILVADDSFVARTQVKTVLDQLGVEATVVNDGLAAYNQLLAWVDEGKFDDPNWLAMIISDIEMPQMDGYSLVSKIREHPVLKGLYVVLHTSMSGDFNESMIESVGADQFLAKFAANDLAATVEARLHVVVEATAKANGG